MATKPEAKNPWAIAGRQQKALAMAVVIDANAVNQGLSPFDQAGRILLASADWSDAIWEGIGERARKPNGERYERKPVSEETRAMVRDIYRGRAQAPVSKARAS